jgi:hypothetical protein
MFDFRIPRVGPWYCFFQTHESNLNDGDGFVRANDGLPGVGQTGYSTAHVHPGEWQRLLVSVDNPHRVYRLYTDAAVQSASLPGGASAGLYRIRLDR